MYISEREKRGGKKSQKITFTQKSYGQNKRVLI
jgi:hypothetical protein